MEKTKEGKFYITTPIYYVNDVPHIGSAYTTIAADVIARWHRLLGEDVFFLTGTDEHGKKIQQVAKEKGKKPKEFVDSIVALFKKAWKVLSISYDNFIRTTDKKHEEAVKKVLLELYNKKFIYKGKYKAYYCIGCEQYLRKSDLVDGKCKYHQKEPEEREEEAYMFKLSAFKGKLLDLIKSGKYNIVPIERRNEVISFIERGLQDIPFSRKKEEVSWGIELPFDKKCTTYVWVDAFWNYLTGLGKEKFEKFWPPDVQLMANDILRVHSTIWPSLLLAMEIELPKKLFIHGYFTVNGEKMSKSLGNVINPIWLVQKYGADSLRYFLIREIPFGQDGDFSEEALKRRYNTELADKLGNLISRIAGLAEKFSKGKLPQGRIDDQLVDQLQLEDIKKNMLELELDKALALIFAFIDSCNVYIQEKRPWEIPSKPKSMKEIKNILYTLTDSLRVTAILLSPFMPETAEKIAKQLGVKLGTLNDCKFGLTKATQIKKGPVLFEKIKK